MAQVAVVPTDLRVREKQQARKKATWVAFIVLSIGGVALASGAAVGILAPSSLTMVRNALSGMKSGHSESDSARKLRGAQDSMLSDITGDIAAADAAADAITAVDPAATARAATPLPIVARTPPMVAAATVTAAAPGISLDAPLPVPAGSPTHAPSGGPSPNGPALGEAAVAAPGALLPVPAGSFFSLSRPMTEVLAYEYLFILFIIYQD
jgi:hypothetical protein